MSDLVAELHTEAAAHAETDAFLQGFDELDPDYQFSSARMFFTTPELDIAALDVEIWLSPKLAARRLAKRRDALIRRRTIGLEVWEPPPGKGQ